MTVGTTDVVTFYDFGKGIHQNGLIPLYRNAVAFNHTPLVGKYVELAYVLADDGKSARLFAYFLRLPGILSDLCAIGVLLWVLGLFAVSPVAFAVSGYHGNVDSVMTLGVLLAGVACAFERPALCGFFLGLSCNIKIIPVFLAPALFFHWLKRGKVWRFTLPAVGVVLVGWAVPLISIPVIFLKDVLGYSSVWGVWGITYFLRLTGLPELSGVRFFHLTPTQTVIIAVLKIFVVASVITMAWRRRGAKSADIFTLLALSWGIFFVFAPGFGSQYLVWLAPCFLLASERWYAALTVASSAALIAFYTIISGGVPWFRGFVVHRIADQWTPWFVPVWGVLAAYLWVHRKQMIAGEEAAPVTTPSGTP